MAASDAKLVRSLYDAFNRGDRDPVRAVLHHEVEWGNAIELHHGRAGFESWWDGIEQGFREFVAHPVEVIEFARRVIVVCQEHGVNRATEVSVSMRFVHVWALEGGLVTSFRAYPTLDDALEAAGAHLAPHEREHPDASMEEVPPARPPSAGPPLRESIR